MTTLEFSNKHLEYIRLNCNIVAYSGANNSRVRLISLFATKMELSSLKEQIKSQARLDMYRGDDRHYKGVTLSEHCKVYASYDNKMNYYHVLVADYGYSDMLFVYKDENYIDWDINSSNIPQQIIDGVYTKLSTQNSFPIAKEWIPRIIRYLRSKDAITRCYIENDTNARISCYHISTFNAPFAEEISKWLKNGEITIGDSKASEFMAHVSSVEEYLNHYHNELTKKIEASFAPRFNPETDSYSPAMEHLCGYLSYAKQINLYGAQKAIVQASSNTLDKKDCVFIVGEQGTGKTLMSTATAYVNNANKKYMTNIVMCPGQLVEKWAREIGRIPNSKAIIISSFDDLMREIPKLKTEKRHYHLWLVLSKETAKFDYNMRPAGVYKTFPVYKVVRHEKENAFTTYKAKRVHYEVMDHNSGYACPSCNKLITGYPNTWPRSGHKMYLGIHGFSEQRSVTREGKLPNIVCPHCGEPLWQAAEKCDVDHESKWIYIAKAQGDHAKIGWIERSVVESEYARILNSNTRTREEEAMLIPLRRAVDEYFAPIYVGGSYGTMARDAIKAEYKKLIAIEYPTDEDKENLKLIDKAMNVIRRAATGYTVKNGMALGKYIYRKLKHVIDYAIIDEVHELKGKDTLQGEAFAQISRAARKTICLTGTLTNGEASSLFYMLYRTVPGMMKKHGFNFNTKSVTAFVNKYGVTEEKVTFQGRRRSTTTKELPGISPAVFTDFLLENAVFVSLDDMADDLPAYEEIPIGVEMDNELKTSYNNLVQQVKNIFTGEGSNSISGGIKSCSQILQSLTTFPDQPYEQPPILNLETQKELIELPELDKTVLRAKDKALIDLIRRKKEAGERVLVYYSYPGRCDHLKETLSTELKKYDISFEELTSNVSAAKREAWIAKKVDKDKIDVLLCNPELVKTGLDLLAFSTIVFYQPVINLSTMMQASRRSWRIGQTHDVEVYFMYYKDTVQEAATITQASRKQAAMVIQGKFNAEGLEAMANESSIAIRLINDLVEGIEQDDGGEERDVFKSARIESHYKAQKKVERWVDKHNKRIFPVVLARSKKRSNVNNNREVSRYNDLMLAIC